MLRSIPKGPQSGDGDLTPEQVAKDVLAGLEQETFVILPHPQVLGYMRKKTENYDRWIAGMAKIQAKMREAVREVTATKDHPLAVTTCARMRPSIAPLPNRCVSSVIAAFVAASSDAPRASISFLMGVPWQNATAGTFGEAALLV